MATEQVSSADLHDAEGNEWHVIRCECGHPLHLITRKPGTDTHELCDIRTYCASCGEGWKIDVGGYARPLTLARKEPA